MSTSRSTGLIRWSFFGRETCKHLPGRPSGKTHGGGVLEFARSLKTLANLVERSDGPARGLEELEIKDKKKVR